MSLVNPFTRPGKWYKANLHTHTTTSDGKWTVPEVIDLYRRNGYRILAITDHHKTNDLSGLSRRDFLLISGMEYHPPCAKRAFMGHHLVALNVPCGFAFSKAIEKNANACIRAVKAVGGETILAHPYWCGHRYDQFAYLKGFIGVEVYNAICDRIGRSSSEEDWSHLIDAGRVLPALAVDDSHDRASDACRGWTWLKLPRLTVPAVMGALRTGCFFSSTGPKINHFGIRRGVVEVHCSPAVAIYLVGFGWCGARLEAPAGKPIRRMVQKIGRDWRYVRAVVVDASGKKAWTNPISL